MRGSREGEAERDGGALGDASITGPSVPTMILLALGTGMLRISLAIICALPSSSTAPRTASAYGTRLPGLEAVSAPNKLLPPRPPIPLSDGRRAASGGAAESADGGAR